MGSGVSHLLPRALEDVRFFFREEELTDESGLLALFVWHP